MKLYPKLSDDGIQAIEIETGLGGNATARREREAVLHKQVADLKLGDKVQKLVEDKEMTAMYIKYEEAERSLRHSTYDEEHGSPKNEALWKDYNQKYEAMKQMRADKIKALDIPKEAVDAVIFEYSEKIRPGVNLHFAKEKIKAAGLENTASAESLAKYMVDENGRSLTISYLLELKKLNGLDKLQELYKNEKAHELFIKERETRDAWRKTDRKDEKLKQANEDAEKEYRLYMEKKVKELAPGSRHLQFDLKQIFEMKVYDDLEQEKQKQAPKKEEDKKPALAVPAHRDELGVLDAPSFPREAVNPLAQFGKSVA